MKTRSWGEPLLCATLAALIFTNSLPAGFVYDDNRAILQNNDARWGSPVSSLFTNDFWGTPVRDKGSHGSWRPLTTLTFRLNHLVAGGLHAWHYHVTNVAMHAVVTALFASWTKSVVPSGPASTVASLIFAVHPVHCEAVAGLVGRAELGQAAAMLLALLAHRAHTKHRTTREHRMKAAMLLLATVCFATVASLFKEQGLFTLLLCGVCDVLVHVPLNDVPALILGGRVSKGRAAQIEGVRSGLRTLFACSAALVCLRLVVAGGTLPRFAVADNPAAHDPSFVTRSLTFLHLPAFNAILFLCPVTLSFDWSMDSIPLVTSWADVRNLESIAFYVAMCALLKTKNRRVLICLAAAAITFLPASNLLGHVGFVAAERVLYAPSAGLSFLLGLGFSRLWNHAHRTTLAVLFLLWFSALGLRTWRRNYDWLSEESLYRSGLSVNPPKAYGNLGSILASQGRSEEAELCYKRALSHRPNMADVHYNLGLLLLQAGGPSRLEEAESSLRAAIAYRPKLAAAHVALGVALARRGAVSEAEAVLHHATGLDGTGQRDSRAHQAAKANALLHLGRLLLERRQDHDALETLLRARDAMPSNYHQPQSVFNLLGEAYGRLGRSSDAESWVRASIVSKPDHLPAYINLAKLLAANETRVSEAELWLQRALELSPGNLNALRVYGEFLLRRARHPEAARMLERVLEQTSPSRRYPDLVNAATAHRLAGNLHLAEHFYIQARDLRPQEASSHGNLGACLHLAGRLAEAQQSYERALALQPTDSVTQNNLHRLRRLMAAHSGE